MSEIHDMCGDTHTEYDPLPSRIEKLGRAQISSFSCQGVFSAENFHERLPFVPLTVHIDQNNLLLVQDEIHI